MEHKQTAVEWLMENLHTAKDPFTQAKEMEKQQMDKVAGDFWNEGASYVYNGQRKYNSFEQYYNEEYGK